MTLLLFIIHLIFAVPDISVKLPSAHCTVLCIFLRDTYISKTKDNKTQFCLKGLLPRNGLLSNAVWHRLTVT